MTISDLQPILDLLGGKAGWLGTVITWFGAAQIVLRFADTRIRHWVSDKLNASAASAETDDDELLRGLFSRRWWKIAALVFPLPKLADLDRALKLQAEAIATKSKVEIHKQSGTGDL